MNRIYLATSGPIEREDGLIDQLEELAKRYDGDVVSIIEYNKEMLFEKPQVFVERLKEIDATHICFVKKTLRYQRL